MEEAPLNPGDRSGRRARHPPRDAASQAWRALGRVAERAYVVLDTETTGLLDPELVAVAVVDHRGGEVLNELVRPGKAIDPGASRITKIDADVVRDKPEFPAIEPRLRAAIDGKLVVIYNASYDLKALRNTYARYGLPEPPFETWCAMEWFAQVYGEWNEARGTYTWQSLAKAAEYFGIPQATPHDALDDTMTLWRILQEAGRRVSGRVTGMRPLFGA